MKETKFTTKEGKEGSSFSLETGDKVKSRFAKVGVNNSGQYTNYFLGVTDSNGAEITVKISEGQKKVLDQNGDLTDKTIVAEEYTNSYGTFVGVRVQE